MTSKVKIKQLTSENESFGKVLISDGNSGFTFYNISGLTTVIEKGTTFPSNPSGGTLYYRTDVDLLFYYDSSRLKWLTVEQHTLTCGRTSAAASTTTYMRVGDATQNSTSGFKMIKNGTIMGASVVNDNTLTTIRPIDVRVNNSTVNKVDLTMLTGTTSTVVSNSNLDFVTGDVVQVVAVGAAAGSALSNVIVVIDLAYRI